MSKLDRGAKVSNGQMPPKRRLAVVTTYDDLCGIAGFSRCLVRALKPHFDLEVFDLDQFLLRLTDQLGRRKADKYFKEMCRRLAKFDVVNLQLEFGTLGALEKDIFRRLRWLLKAAPELSVTFHTVPRREVLDREHLARLLRRFRVGEAIYYLNSVYKSTSLLTYRMLRRYARRRPLKLFVHTRRDRRFLEVVQDFKNVYDHPLSFLQVEEVAGALADAKTTPFASMVNHPENCKAIGVFGFLSAYKGFETAIQAMRYLPENYHLYIFGGLHPNDIAERRIASYVVKLIREVVSDYTLLDRLAGSPGAPDENQDKSADTGRPPVRLSVRSVAEANQLVEGQRDSLVKRVHFVGTLSDEEFNVAMASCDIVVLPYHEVMQSSSGPASLSIELGRRTLLSRTRGFLQLGRYFPKRVEYFDIGNHLQLLSLLQREPPVAAYPECKFSMETLCRMYVETHGGEPVQQIEGNSGLRVGNGHGQTIPADPSNGVPELQIGDRSVAEGTIDHPGHVDAHAGKREEQRKFRKLFSGAQAPVEANKQTVKTDSRPIG